MQIQKGLLGTLTMLVVLSAGCEAEPEREEEVQPAPAADVADVAPPAAMGAPGPSPEVVAYAVPLQPVAGSGVSGEGTLEREGDQARIRVRLTGTPGGTTHQGHIHQGASCADIGSVVAPLDPITTDGQGVGEMTTTTGVELDQLMDDSHLIVYHEAGGDPGRPAACGEIPSLP